MRFEIPPPKISPEIWRIKVTTPVWGGGNLCSLLFTDSQSKFRLKSYRFVKIPQKGAPEVCELIGSFILFLNFENYNAKTSHLKVIHTCTIKGDFKR